VQSLPQLIPLGLELIVPLPVPDLTTVKVKFEMEVVKEAVTVMEVDIATVQVPVPIHTPLHPVNELPDAGVAVKVTIAPVL